MATIAAIYPIPSSTSVQADPREASLYEILSQILTFKDDHQQFWWHNCAPFLNRLFESAGYSLPLQREYLSFFEEYIIPFLKTPGLPSLNPRAILQSSIQYQCTKPTVSLAFELRIPPENSPSGYSNHVAAESLLSLVSSSKLCPSLYRENYQLFADQLLLVHSGPETNVDWVDDQDNMSPCTIFISFTKDAFDPLIGVRFFPLRKSVLNKVSMNDLIFDTIHKFASPQLGNHLAMTTLANFFAESQAKVEVTMVEVECIVPQDAKIRIRTGALVKSFTVIREIYTIGGKLNSRSIWSGLQMLEDLWSLLFHSELPTPQYDDDDSEEFFAGDMAMEGISMEFEISPQALTPTITVWIPVSFVDTDVPVALAKFSELRDSKSIDEYL